MCDPDAKSGAPTKAMDRVVPELELGSLLLKNRHYAHAVLGSPHPENIADCETTDLGYAYSDDSYVCTHNGSVTALSYKIKSSINNPDHALRAVGLQASVGGIQVLATSYVWLQSRGNPISMNGTLIPSVSVILARGHANVFVDMFG